MWVLSLWGTPEESTGSLGLSASWQLSWSVHTFGSPEGLFWSLECTLHEMSGDWMCVSCSYLSSIVQIGNRSNVASMVLHPNQATFWKEIGVAEEFFSFKLECFRLWICSTGSRQLWEVTVDCWGCYAFPVLANVLQHVIYMCDDNSFQVIHDRKFFEDHDLAFSYIAKLLPQVVNDCKITHTWFIQI